MTNTSTSTIIQIVLFGLFLILCLFFYKYFLVDQDPRKDDKIRCPPHLLHKPDSVHVAQNNVVIEDKKPHHKNDLNVVHANNFNMYQEGDNIDTYGFQQEVVQPNRQTFSDELEEVYNLSSIQNHPTFQSEIIKPNKSDLPIANIPMYILKDDEKPLRLSEKPI